MQSVIREARPYEKAKNIGNNLNGHTFILALKGYATDVLPTAQSCRVASIINSTLPS